MAATTATALRKAVPRGPLEAVEGYVVGESALKSRDEGMKLGECGRVRNAALHVCAYLMWHWFVLPILREVARYDSSIAPTLEEILLSYSIISPRFDAHVAL